MHTSNSYSSREGPESAKTRRSIEQDDADNNNPNHIGIHDRTGVPDDNGGSGEDCDRMEALIYNANNMGSKRPPSIHLQTLSWEERMGGENEIQYSAENAGIESIEKRFASTDEYTSSVTVNDLEESGDVLKSKLEVEINQLQSKLSAQESGKRLFVVYCRILYFGNTR